MMKRGARIALAVCLMLAVRPAAASGADLAPSKLLADARAALSNPHVIRADTMVVVDLGRPSWEKRLFLVDLVRGTAEAFYVAHGKGSDRDHDGLADAFGDAPGSEMTPLGAFVGAERYTGKHGASLRLDGLEAGNRNARARAIVLHTEWYVGPEMIAKHGKLGRSQGCFVVEAGVLDRIMAALEAGALLYVGR